MFEKLVSPKSVAIIGASASTEKIGYQILFNLVTGDFGGKIFPVNPKGGEILGLSVYRNIKEITHNIDLAIICIPSAYVETALLECVQKGLKGVIIISAGFAEIGDDGIILQNRIREICLASKIQMLGPNCLGLINTDIGLNASFANGMPIKGNVSFMSQSGAMVSALIDWSKQTGVGFSKIFSLGNKAIMGEAETLYYLYNDKSTGVIISYFEDLKVSDELTKILIRYAKTKPTIVLFGGKSAEGAKAAASHTGSLVSSYLAVETYMRQAGIIVADTLEDLFTYSSLFASFNHINGDRIAIITNAGGPSIAASDSIVSQGMDLAKISPSTQKKLRSILRPCAPVANPIDVLGDATDIEYKQAIEIVASDKEVDGLLVLLTPQSSTKIDETAMHIANFKAKKPIVSAFIGGKSVIEAGAIIKKAGKVSFEYPETGVKALKALCDFSTKKVTIEQSKKGSKILDYNNHIKALKDFNLPVLEYIRVNSENELMEAAKKIGFPVVLKTAKEGVSHKSDANGVILNLKNNEDLISAFAKIGTPAILGKMVRGKHEIFIGIKKDRKVGTVIAFGTGGVYSEIYKDISYRIAPISRKVALEMISETKMGSILSGARGQKGYNLDKIADIIVDTARFADEYQNIAELDFNPMIADENDFYLVDARIIENN